MISFKELEFLLELSAILAKISGYLARILRRLAFGIANTFVLCAFSNIKVILLTSLIHITGSFDSLVVEFSRDISENIVISKEISFAEVFADLFSFMFKININ